MIKVMAEKKTTSNKAEKKKPATKKKATPKNTGNRMMVEFTADHPAGFKKGDKRNLQIRDARILIERGLAKSV